MVEHQILLDRTPMRGIVAARQRGKGHDCCVDSAGLKFTVKYSPMSIRTGINLEKDFNRRLYGNACEGVVLGLSGVVAKR